MKVAASFIAILFLLASCTKDDDQQNPPNYGSLYTGSYSSHLSISISNDLAFTNLFQVPDHADVNLNIKADTNDCNKIWISGLYGTSQSIPAMATASGFNLIPSGTGMHPADIGFAKLNGQVDPYFDILTIDGNYINGLLQYNLSDNGLYLVSCSGTLNH